MKKPTLKEINELVTFERGEEGSLRVKSVWGNVLGYIKRNVEGSIWGNVEGDVRGNVWGRKKEAAS